MSHVNLPLDDVIRSAGRKLGIYVRAHEGEYPDADHPLHKLEWIIGLAEQAQKAGEQTMAVSVDDYMLFGGY